MFATIMKELSLKDLIKELISREKQLAISKANKADNHLIDFNKLQLQIVQKAIAEKTVDTTIRN